MKNKNVFFLLFSLLTLPKSAFPDDYTFKDIYNFPKGDYESQSKLFKTYCKYANKFNDSRGKYYRKDIVSSKSCRKAANKLNNKCYSNYELGEDPITNFRTKLNLFTSKERKIEAEYHGDEITYNMQTKKLNDEVKDFYKSKEFSEYKKFLGNQKKEILEIEENCFIKNKKIKAVEKIMKALSVPNSGSPMCETLKSEYPEFTDYRGFKNGKLIKRILQRDKTRASNTLKPSPTIKGLKYSWNISLTQEFRSIDSGVGTKCFGDESEDRHCLLPAKGISEEKYINKREGFWSNKKKYVNKAIKNTEYVSALLKTPEFRRLAFACSPITYSNHFRVKRREHKKDCEKNQPYSWTPSFLATELPFQCQVILSHEYHHRYRDQRNGLYKLKELKNDMDASSTR
tara:strand:- start:4010 stop:5209 length:1200 start_codon:yes stop_codon:yes gene_type:complete